MLFGSSRQGGSIKYPSNDVKNWYTSENNVESSVSFKRYAASMAVGEDEGDVAGGREVVWSVRCEGGRLAQFF